jgi:hypothetical protein
MGLSPSDAQTGSTARGKLACHFGDNFAGEGKLTEKRVSHTLLWEWKCHLMNLKAEVDRALISVFEGLEMGGPSFKPKVVGQKKRKKCWAQKNPKPNSHVLKPRESQGSALAVVLPVEGLVPRMGFGGVRNVESSPARSEVASGLVFVSPPPFFGVSVPVSSSIEVVFKVRSYRCDTDGRLRFGEGF